MGLSLIDQDAGLRASRAYSGSVTDAHTQAVAEAQIYAEGDFNVLRTGQKALSGADHWYDLPLMSLRAIAQKYEQNGYQPSGFFNVATGTGNSSTAFDIAIKSIANHLDGAGASDAEGVVLHATMNHEVVIRNYSTRNSIDDGLDNEVYGRLSHSSTPVESGDDNNQLSAYADITGVTDANTDAEKALHFSIVDDTGGFFHIDLYKEVARTNLVGHTATYNSTGAKAITADNASGLGGTVTVDAVTAVDVDIKVIFGQYTISWYSWQSGAEVAYTFTSSVNVILLEVLVSRMFKDRPWTRPYHPSFHDTAGLTGSVADDNVVVDGMAHWLTGLTSQATVNAKIDKLGQADTDGEGAYGIGMDDSATGTNGYFTLTSLQGIVEELVAQIGGATSTTYDYTTNGVVLADDDVIYASLNKLNERHNALNTADTNGSGTDLLQANDQNSYWPTATSLTDVLDLIWEKAIASTRNKKQLETTVLIAANTNWTLPFSMAATVDATHCAYLDLAIDGRGPLYGGSIAAGDDMEQVDVNTIKFKNPVPANRNLVIVSHG